MYSSEILNKGVPTKLPLPVEFNVNDLIQICKNTKDLAKQIDDAKDKFYNLACDKLGSEIADFFNLKNSNSIEIYIDENTLEKKLIFSTSNIFNEIAYLVNDDLIMYYDFSAIDRAIKRIESISEEDFKKEYPNLYKYYLNSKAINASLIQYKKNLKHMDYVNVMNRINMVSKLLNCSYDTARNKINVASPNYNYKSFLSEFIKILRELQEKSKSLIPASLDSDNNIFVDANLEINESDREKLEMYIAYVYQDMLKIMKDEYQQEYLYYISTYYFENKELINKNKKFYSKYYDKIINLKDMYEDYKKILASSPTLRVVDLNYNDFNGMNLSEVDDFMKEYHKGLMANWDFFDNSKIDDENLNKIKSYYSNPKLNYSQEDIEKIINLFIEKKEFFDRTDPYYRILGKNTFDGYVGYIYSNGIVALEKFFENSKTGKIAKNQAIYIMSIQDFYNLTQLSKNEIILNKLCKRFIHKGNWKEKVEEAITSPQIINPSSEVDELKNRGVIK